jgi:hypothetical protein
LQQAIPAQYQVMWGRNRDELEQVPTLTVLAIEIVKSISSMPKPHPKNFQLFFGRFDDHARKVTAIVRGNLPWTAQIADMISTTFDPSISFSSKGDFTLQLEAPVGGSFHTQMIERLNLLVRATAFLTTLKSHHITPTYSTVSQITFNYPRLVSATDSSEPSAPNAESTANSKSTASLACEVTFYPDASAVPTIRFLPTSENPHNRISQALSELFAKKSARDFLAVVHITLPLLRAIQRVELNGNLVRAWNFFKYRLVYRGAQTVFEIICKLVDGHAEWQVYETRAGGNQQANPRMQIPRPQGYEEMMRDFFAKSEPGIRPLKSMLVCNSESIERAIDELDRIVRDKIATSPPTQLSIAGQQAGGPSALNAGQPSTSNARSMPPNQANRQQVQQQNQQRMGQQQNRPANRGPGPNSHVVTID